MTRAQIINACQAIFRRGTKPTLPEVNPLVEAYYALPGNGSGGQLHVVLDDGNYQRRFIRGSVESADATPLTKNLGHVLLMLSNSQRRKL